MVCGLWFTTTPLAYLSKTSRTTRPAFKTDPCFWLLLGRRFTNLCLCGSLASDCIIQEFCAAGRPLSTPSGHSLPAIDLPVALLRARRKSPLPKEPSGPILAP